MIDVRELQEQVDQFNDKYQVNFDYEQFDVQYRKYNNLGMDKPADIAYALVFAQYYKYALRNAVLGNIKDIDSDQMRNDFEKMLMAPYREKCKAAGETDVSSPYGGKTRQKALESMKIYANEAPKNKAEFYGEQYASGKVRLRDLRLLAERYDKNDYSQCSVVANSIVGLEKVHASRSIFWKIRHPIQNYCEARDIKYMKEEADFKSLGYHVDDGTGVIEAEMTNLDRLIRREKAHDTRPIEREKFGDARESLTEEEIAAFEEESIYEESEMVADEDELNVSKTSSL